jgi:hypothetical protein
VKRCLGSLANLLLTDDLEFRWYVTQGTIAPMPFVLIRVSLMYRGRAIPLAWRAVRRASTKVSFEDYQPVLDQVGPSHRLPSICCLPEASVDGVPPVLSVALT